MSGIRCQWCHEREAGWLCREAGQAWPELYLCDECRWGFVELGFPTEKEALTEREGLYD